MPCWQLVTTYRALQSMVRQRLSLTCTTATCNMRTSAYRKAALKLPHVALCGAGAAH